MHLLLSFTERKALLRYWRHQGKFNSFNIQRDKNTVNNIFAITAHMLGNLSCRNNFPSNFLTCSFLDCPCCRLCSCKASLDDLLWRVTILTASYSLQPSKMIFGESSSLLGEKSKHFNTKYFIAFRYIYGRHYNPCEIHQTLR